VLAVIQVESAGDPEAVNKTSGASGLMQVMPIALRDFNNHHKKSPVAWASLRGKTLIDIKNQIRVGMWVMGQYLRSAHKFIASKLPAVEIENLIKMADHFYAAGPAGTKKRIGNTPPDTRIIAQKFPGWSPVRHARKIWDYAQKENPKWDLQKINDWVKGIVKPVDPYYPIEPVDPGGGSSATSGLLIGLVVLALVAYFMKGKK
jgi:hypothetical protein